MDGLPGLQGPQGLPGARLRNVCSLFVCLFLCYCGWADKDLHPQFFYREGTIWTAARMVRTFCQVNSRWFGKIYLEN